MRLPRLCERKRQGKAVGYYVKIQGQQIWLGTDLQAAEAAYRRLVVDQLSPRNQIEREQVQVGKVTGRLDWLIMTYLDWCQQHRAVATYNEASRILLDFAGEIPKGMTVGELKRAHVLDWLDSHPRWKAGGRRSAISSLQTMLNWHVERENIRENPIRGLKRPAKGRRETVVTPEQRAAFEATITEPEFRDFYTLLVELPVRPIELRALEAKHVDLGAGIATFPREENKSGEATGRARILYLTPTAVAILRPLIDKHPSGPLLRHPSGHPWTRHTINRRYRKARKLVPGLPVNYSAYVDRHTAITDAICKGLPDAVVAELAGHVDTTMIAKVYGHMRAKRDDMLAAAAKISRGRPPLRVVGGGE